MVNSVNNISSTMLGALFANSSGSSTQTFGISADVLAAWASAKAGITNTNVDPTADPNAPTEPLWTPGVLPADDTLVSNALAGKPFFDTSAQLYSDLNANGDYKRLFALYSGVTALQALATKATDTTLSSYDQQQIQTQFARGVSELQSFFQTQHFDDVRVAEGDRVDSEQSTLAIPPASEDYTTGVLSAGATGAITGLDPNAKFDIQATSLSGNVHNVTIDLSQMGSIPRSLSNVVGFINNKLLVAGVQSNIELVNQSPANTTLNIGGQTITLPYTGQPQYALKINVQGGEQIAFQPDDSDPAFYVVGSNTSGARLIKLADTSGGAGQPLLLDRPDATAAPIGPDVATGWLNSGDAAFTTNTQTLVASGSNNFETNLRAAGDATLSVTLGDGRVVSVTTAWRDGDQQAWANGDSSDQGILSDVAQRLTQLLHEQGVAAGVTTWADGADGGLSIQTGDGVQATSLSIGGLSTTLTPAQDPPGMTGGLRDGVFARQYSAANVASDSQLFIGSQTVSIGTGNSTKSIVINGGLGGIDSTTFLQRLNDGIREQGIQAAASFTDTNGQLSLVISGTHQLVAANANLNGVSTDATLQPPAAGQIGGLPTASAGEPYGDAVRETDVSGSPLTDNPGAVDVQVVVATPSRNKTVSVSVSAAERAADPDTAPGQWSQAFQDRLNTALNQAGVYVGAVSNDLTQWKTAEDFGQRIQSISINGVAQTLTDSDPSLGPGGAFSVERSFTSAQGSTGAASDSATVPALQANQNVSVSFDTAWGPQTVSAALQPGDPPTLDSAALRLNQALSAAGYDLGVEVTDLAGGGSGLRAVTGASHTVRDVSSIALGSSSLAVTLDPIDSQITYAPGAVDAADRASRGAAASVTIPNSSANLAPSGAAPGWFPGRAFDVPVSGGSQVATARDVATGADGSVYVLADLSGDSATLPIKGARDVALIKYDSAGNLAYTRILGASDSASGYALAVSNDGKVAVAGSVTGDLAGASPAKGGADSFVSLFDANGNQIWTQRRAATADDQANAVAFTSSGAVIVAGQTASSLGPVFSAGGVDGYLTGFSAAGSQLFVKQFGTTGDDAATALTVADDGNGGTQIFTGGVENNRGVVRSFDYSSSSGLTTGPTRDIGLLMNGSINALATDGTNVYVGGQIGADRLSLATTAQPSVAGQDGFVARLSTNLADMSQDRATYIGSAQDDGVSGLAVVNGTVYASGTTNGVIAGQGSDNTQAGFLTRLDSSGRIDWTRVFTSSGGAITANALAVDQSGASALDALGLPRGAAVADDSSALVMRSSVKTGDQFQIGGDAKSLSTITISATDTMTSLAAKINLAIGGAGFANVVKDDNGAQRIQINSNDGKQVVIQDGASGKNALPGLGLTPGVIAVNQTARGSIKNFGLGLNADELSLADSASITKSQAVLSAAQSIITQAYDALLHPNAAPETDEQKALDARKAAAGTAPAYLSAQLANYQAALARLGGGSTSGSTTGINPSLLLG